MKYNLNYCKSSNSPAVSTDAGYYFTARGRCEEVQHYACYYLHEIQVNQFIHLF